MLVPSRPATREPDLQIGPANTVKRAFNTDPDVEPLRNLICTDAAREGINLQSYCSDLIHFDLPWNPSRLEQRNGRIDRRHVSFPFVGRQDVRGLLIQNMGQYRSLYWA
jgi:superfamily II DNA/RNA helicase